MNLLLERYTLVPVLIIRSLYLFVIEHLWLIRFSDKTLFRPLRLSNQAG